MKTGVYIPNDVLEAAGRRYYAAMKLDESDEKYTISELVQVGLRILATSGDTRIRANRPRLATGNAPEVPGLVTKVNTKAGEGE